MAISYDSIGLLQRANLNFVGLLVAFGVNKFNHTMDAQAAPMPKKLPNYMKNRNSPSGSPARQVRWPIAIICDNRPPNDI